MSTSNFLDTVIYKFEPISLVEMGSAELMVRSDLKFGLTVDNLLRILPELVKEYRILEINNKRLFEYDTL